MTTDPHTLVGPYVVDALGPDEQAAFEEHLRGCPECRAEVDDLRAAAARLGGAVASSPPPDLRDRVLADAARTRQAAPGPRPQPVPRRRWPALVAAAAVLVLLAALGGLALQADRRADRADDLVAIVADPGARSVALDGDEGTMRLVVSPAHDTSVLLAEGLPAPPGGKTYALWFDRDGRMVPVGLFAPDGDGQVRQRVDGVPPGVVGVTIEPEGGSDRPTLPIIAQGST